MHPALLRLIRVLAECEAERLCAEKEADDEASTAESECTHLMKNPKPSRENRSEREP